MKHDADWERDRKESRVRLLGIGLFLKGAAIVFFLAGVVYVLSPESTRSFMRILLLVALPAIILWVLSVVVRGIAHIEENTRPAPPTMSPESTRNRSTTAEDDDTGQDRH